MYEGRYAYVPRPADVAAIVPGADAKGHVRTLASVVGVRRADRKSALPASIEVRVLMENATTGSVAFDPASLVLLSADLTTFPAPIVDPPGRVELAPDGTASLTAYFPLPEGGERDDLDLGGLNLRWTVQVDGRLVSPSVSFTRLDPVARYPYQSRVGLGIGYTFSH